MRCRDKDEASARRVPAGDQRPVQEGLGFCREPRGRVRDIHDRVPDGQSRILGEDLGEQPPWLCPTTTISRRAGSDPDGSKVAIALARPPADGGRHRDRLARGVQEHPELVVIGQYGVVAQLVVRFGPTQRAGDQSMDEHHRDLPGLIRAKEGQALLEPPQVRGHDPGKGCTPQPPAAIHLHGQPVVRSAASGHTLPPASTARKSNGSFRMSVKDRPCQAPPVPCSPAKSTAVAGVATSSGK